MNTAIMNLSVGYSGAYLFGRLLGTIVISVIFGVVCRKICENKGYYGAENHGFLWGFFLGWIGLIVCVCKQNRNLNNYNNYYNPNMYNNNNNYNQYQNGYDYNGYYTQNRFNPYNQNGYGQNGSNGQNDAGYDPNGAANGYVDLSKQKAGSNNNNYYNR